MMYLRKGLPCQSIDLNAHHELRNNITLIGNRYLRSPSGAGFYVDSHRDLSKELNAFGAAPCGASERKALRVLVPTAPPKGSPPLLGFSSESAKEHYSPWFLALMLSPRVHASSGTYDALTEPP